MTVVHIRGDGGTWTEYIKPHDGDILHKDGKQFRVIERSWSYGVLHCDVVRVVVEEEGDGPQVPRETD